MSPALTFSSLGVAFAFVCFGTRSGSAEMISQGEAETERSLSLSPQRVERTPEGRTGVFKDRITAHWFDENRRFWYRNILRDGVKEFVLVEVERGIRKPAFDHAKLADRLSEAVEVTYAPERLPFDRIAFVDGAVVFKVGATTWRCDLESYECRKSDSLPDLESPENASVDAGSNQSSRPRLRQNSLDGEGSNRSPDGQWTAFIRDHNLFIRGGDGIEIQLSRDGREGFAYGRLGWAPDSKTLVGFRIEPGDRKEVYLVESSPPGGGRAKLQTRPYALPGDKFTTYELNLFDISTREQKKPAVDRFEHGWERPRLHWRRGGRRLAYEQTDRGHQRFRVIEVDAQSGEVRTLVDDRSKTFIWTAHTENLNLRLVNWLQNTEEFIYVSERDGWRHLYLVDALEGRIQHQITSGEFVVRGIDRIDEEARQVWFHAGGFNRDQDPYFIHYYRVNFDGSGLVALTHGNGTHTIQYSPDRKHLIDTYSRVDMAPVHELRRVSDGTLVCELEQADISDLRANDWQPPEIFVAKGRDGKTDIWGIISRPAKLDPDRLYPIIEDIYAGPQGSFVPKSFSAMRRYGSLTERGFIVVKIDGMGTANRSKAFHDVCWKNLKDAGFPDRILWMKAAAAKYPYMDLSRVGIYGNSAGGQNAAAAVLFHPEFYKVAVASCGCHDNRMDKASWNEQWMGYPVGPQYSESSNIDNAHRLLGNLFLIVGELDTNVPPESTFRFVDALIKAGKDFDLLVIPGGGHGIGGAYGQRRMHDFFARHLLGSDPLDGKDSSSIQRDTP